MTSSHAPSPKKYDAFIGFRGDDTRTIFTCHLHFALYRDNIETFIDDDLDKGDDLRALCEAIQDSHVAVVVFSENYADSKWCLKELVEMLKCRKSQGLVVIPVFYNVDPSDVRNQTGSFKEALAKVERDLKDKDKESIQRQLSEWKAALTEAGKISGWDSRGRGFKNDKEFIEKIVKDISEKLDLRSPNELQVEGLVGIDKIREDFELLLSKNKKNLILKNVQVIGIWGMGGIGKTTIAKAVFSQLFPQYDSVCFLGNVREESKRFGITSLRDKLLFELLKEENPQSNPGGSKIRTRRLNNKKVFIVLDDVDNLDQLNVLFRECKDVGPDSKLIITTRNKHLLSRTVDEIYQVNTWSFDQSLELFSLHAFNKRHPEDGYEDLSKRAVDYASGVPLALKVLGSNLWSESTEIWNSKLNKLKKCPDDGIQNVLQVSYDDLDRLEKKIFLDIAFFFKDEHKDYVIRILDACGFHPGSGVKVLKDKALITISNNGRIQMHDLIQEMGLKIVRQDIEDPRKRSRLRDIEEVSDVLKNKKGSHVVDQGSHVVEGITLDLSQIKDLHLSANAFNMMTDLRFLKLYIPSGKRSGNMHYPRVLNKISDELRYLEWHGYRLKSLPAAFCAEMLVEIRMPHSHVTELWRGVQDLVNLEGIDLRECKQLKKLPDLSQASELKRVDLSGCESLSVVHPSVLALDSLETLILDGCKNLKSLKSEKHSTSLSEISVNGCTSLKEFSVSSDSMVSLNLRNAGIENLHSIGRNLESLDLEGLRLGNLPDELPFLKSLKELRISNGRLLVIDKQKLHALFDGIRYLRKLCLEDCCNLSELPDNISGLSQLRELRLDGSSVETLPASIKHLPKLEILSLKDCMKLKCLPEPPPCIKELYAVNCRSLVTISTFKNFAAEMTGKEKYVSFENSLQVDGSSLHCIMEGAQLTMMSAVFHNVRHRLNADGHNCKTVKFCLPGSRVPGWFTYRTTRSSSITIDLPSRNSNLHGFILSAVLSPSEEMKKQHGAKIRCQCYLPDGTEIGYMTTWEIKPSWS